MLWIKVFHLLFVIAWMSGLFYLPRILVHYREGQDFGEDIRRLTIMAAKLKRFSLLMALLAIATGSLLWLAPLASDLPITLGDITGNWLVVKFLFVAGLLAYQWQTHRYISQMQARQPIRTSLFFRFYNEAALLLLLPILILAVLRPF